LAQRFVVSAISKYGLVLWKCSEILANCGDHPHTQKGRQENAALLGNSEKVYTRCLEKKMPQNNWSKLKDTHQCGLYSGP